MNSEFSFSLTGYITEAIFLELERKDLNAFLSKENLHKEKHEKKHKEKHKKKKNTKKTQRETQKDASKIWTRVTDSISYDDNRHTKCTS